MEKTISNFPISFIFQQSRSWRFTLHMYKYWVQITVVTLVELSSNAANNIKMCYVVVIHVSLWLLVFPIKYNHNTMEGIDLCLLWVLQ